jgi:hypothetical protein
MLRDFGATIPHPNTPTLTGTHSPRLQATTIGFQESAKGADARRQTSGELASSSGGALDPETVLRVFPKTAKGADARRQTSGKLASSSGGALDPETVLRVR